MKLGRYEVLGELGRGGMGIVYRATGPDGRVVAVKLLSKTGGLALDRFQREERLLQSFTEADGFVPMLDAGVFESRPFFVMPFLAGGTLRARLEQGPIAIPDAIAVGRSLARALGIAHERGIVHRDLKPENVIFTSDGRPLVADLGLAKHFRHEADEASLTLSTPGMIMGTPGYMPYEQLRDAKRAGPRADVFAIGVTLYECLTGVRPFEADSVIELIARVESGSFPSVRDARPETPAWLANVVSRALSREAEDRYATGSELDHALAGGSTALPTATAIDSRVPERAFTESQRFARALAVTKADARTLPTELAGGGGEPAGGQPPSGRFPASGAPFPSGAPYVSVPLPAGGPPLAGGSPTPSGSARLAVRVLSGPTAKAPWWRSIGLFGCTGMLLTCLACGGLLGIFGLGETIDRSNPGTKAGLARAHASPILRELLGGDFKQGFYLLILQRNEQDAEGGRYEFTMTITGPKASGELECRELLRKDGYEVVEATFTDGVTGKRTDILAGGGGASTAPVGSAGPAGGR